MTVQRNNIARMPWRLREIVYRMLFEGASGDQVRAEIARLDPAAPVPHNTSIQAIRERDADYAAWRKRAMGMAADQQRRRTTWAATDDGSGNGFAVPPGATLSLPVGNANAVYVIGTAGDIIYVTGN